jgi:hypothetical protein
MEIKTTTAQVLKVFQILSWIIFIGLCIEAGGIFFNIFYTFFIDPINTNQFWDGADLSALYQFNPGQFIVITVIMTIIAFLKAIMFFRIVKIFTDKKLNMAQPFNADLRQFMLLMSYLSLGIGLFSFYGLKYSGSLVQKGVTMPDAQALNMAGADVWLFMSVILFVIVQIVKRGIEIQTENDLTI